MSRELRKRIVQASRELRRLTAAINDEIAKLPDNPRIKRLSKQAFTISSKDLGKNWSAEHHDFKVQYRMIIAALNRVKPNRVLAKLRAIIRSEQVEQGYRSKLNLHPDVVAHLRSLLEK